MLRHIAHDEQV